MKKNIIVISSTPRKAGNSELLCGQFALGAEQSGHETGIVHLRESRINYCTGCGVCSEQGKPCPHKDDMAGLLDRLIRADVVVMATPVYFYAMCGQMKTFIDRCCSRYTEIRNKEFYFILTAAVNSKGALERTVEEFRGYLDCLDGAQEKGIVYGTGAWKIGDIKNSRAMKQAFDMGKAI